jgi:hypothetical protein
VPNLSRIAHGVRGPRAPRKKASTYFCACAGKATTASHPDSFGVVLTTIVRETRKDKEERQEDGDGNLNKRNLGNVHKRSDPIGLRLRTPALIGKNALPVPSRLRATGMCILW